jgi:hypothetical protein
MVSVEGFKIIDYPRPAKLNVAEKAAEYEVRLGEAE